MRMKHAIMASLLASVLALPAFAQTAPAAPATAAPVAPVAPTTANPAVPAVKPVTKPAAPAKPMAGPMSVNTATAPELMKLPGIGKSRSAAIIKGRPYKSVDELDSKKIIPHATYEKIKGQFTL